MYRNCHGFPDKHAALPGQNRDRRSAWHAPGPARRAGPSTMPSTSLSIIKFMKRLSAVCLTLTVAVGAYGIDRRFTMLLLPPFMMYWGEDGQWLELPIVKILLAPFQGGNIWVQRIVLAGAGIAAAMLLDQLMGGG